MADGVTDEDFEAALAEAKTESNLSRANVARKTRRLREDRDSREGQARGSTGVPAGPNWQVESDRIVEVTVGTLERWSPEPGG